MSELPYQRVPIRLPPNGGPLVIITAHSDRSLMARYPIGEWKRRFRQRVPINERKSVSMVYKLYCTRDGPVHYVGRSDLDLIGRIAAHTARNGDRCDHNCRYVEFRIIRNSPNMRDRKKKSFTAESRAYHKYSTNCNSDHPNRKGVPKSHRCPICNH